MTTLEAARRLDQLLNFTLTCSICAHRIKAATMWPEDEEITGHATRCPVLALPRIVAALEAAERWRLALEEVQMMADRGARPPPRSPAEDILVDIVCRIDSAGLEGDI